MLIKENTLIQERVALSTIHPLSARITVILAKCDKHAQHEGCVKIKLICFYKRRREKKEKQTKNSRKYNSL